MDTGTIGGIIGGTLGVIGGIIGTYFSIRNTHSPKEKSFVLKCSIVVWILVTAFICGLIILPKPYNNYLWLPYGFALAFGIKWMNRKQQSIADAMKPKKSQQKI